MIERESLDLKAGYLLLPPSSIPGYRGVDRNPFRPSLIDNELDHSYQAQEGDSRIWVYYRSGWRRDAYRLYEENTVKGTGDTLLYLLSNLRAAREIQKLIQPHVGSHEIVGCQVWGLDSMPTERQEKEGHFLGYDIAYPGGDFYSAILNGLVTNPDSSLVKEYKPLLNEFSLFSSSKPIPEYVHRFRHLVLSEAASEFCVFRLGLER